VVRQRTVAEQSEGDTVERAGRDGFAQVELAQSTTQLAGGVAGEGERQHVRWPIGAGGNPIGDPPGEDPRLARAGSCHDGQRSRVDGDGQVLLGVETHQHALCIHGVTIDSDTVGAMAYPTKNLNPGETVVLDLNPHWWYFAQPVATLVGAIVVGIIYSLNSPDDGTLKTVMSWLVIGFIVVSAIWSVVRYVKWISTHFVVTTNRLIFKQGIVAKTGIEIPLERVNNVNFRQGPFERLIDAGDLLIESGGEAGQQRFTDIKDPDGVQNLISREIESYRDRRDGARGGVAPSVDVTIQLERLEGLLQRGTITQEEFDSQKSKLLG
jgi:membrane protein YdbS with pleckstrin-like domain